MGFFCLEDLLILGSKNVLLVEMTKGWENASVPPGLLAGMQILRMEGKSRKKA